MSVNPFTMTFGKEPIQYISRLSQKNEIVSNFISDNPPVSVYMISGVRGSGKTVFLSNIADELAKHDEWIVVNVTPDSDIKEAIIAKLYGIDELRKIFVKAKIDISAFGIGLSFEKTDTVVNTQIVLEKMLTEIKKKKKKVLITIDEVINNQNVKVFSSYYQVLLREGYPVFLLMTGLYENIYNLQNEKTLTFLYRAPKIMMEPLSMGSIARNYASILKIDNDKAMTMAKITKGYPFAFQVLGYLYYEQKLIQDKVEIEDILGKFDQYMEELVYEKIWFELSSKEKEIIALLIGKPEVKIMEIRENLSLSSGEMSVYRDRLKKKGIIDTSKHSYISFALPRFGEIISLWID